MSTNRNSEQLSTICSGFYQVTGLDSTEHQLKLVLPLGLAPQCFLPTYKSACSNSSSFLLFVHACQKNWDRITLLFLQNHKLAGSNGQGKSIAVDQYFHTHHSREINTCLWIAGSFGEELNGTSATKATFTYQLGPHTSSM
jgi:hypothetical protein